MVEGEELRYYQYYMMYDNVFSVFGKRGTGKTSVAFKLREIKNSAKKEYSDLKDPVVPLIYFIFDDVDLARKSVS